MKKYLLLILLAKCSFAQKKFTVYFDTNSYQLNTIQLNRLDSLFLMTKSLKIEAIAAYCDIRSPDEYNKILAENRAKFVKNLIEKMSKKRNFKIEAIGENFKQYNNLAANRKVEIFYSFNLDERVKNVVQISDDLENSNKTLKLTNLFRDAKIGEKLILENLNFYDKLDVLLPESYPQRDELLNLMLKNPKLKIEIQGHICCTPGKDKQELALKRAITIFKYFVDNGIDSKRVNYKGFDATQPIFVIPEKTAEEQKANRRVEILILAK